MTAPHEKYRRLIEAAKALPPLATSLADTIGWAVSTWYQRPAHIERMRRRAMAQDHSWDRSARQYEELYLAAYARRRGHPFVEAPEIRLPTPAAPKPSPPRVALGRPVDRLPLPARHARAALIAGACERRQQS